MINLSSQDLVQKINDDTARRARLLRSRGVDPHLAAIVVGSDDRFVELKQRRGRELGIETSIYRLPQSARPEDIAGVIGFLNVDPAVHGILIQLPIPLTDKETDELIDSLAPTKDVDGLGPGRNTKTATSLTDLARNAHHLGKFLPTTAWAMLCLAEEYSLPLAKAVVVGQGRLVGQPLNLLLDQLGQKHTCVDRDSKSLAATIAQADLILAGTDSAKPIFNRTKVKKDAAIIAAGQEIDHNDLANWASALTPERGGVGPLTIALLHQQTITAAEQAHV